MNCEWILNICRCCYLAVEDIAMEFGLRGSVGCFSHPVLLWLLSRPYLSVCTEYIDVIEALQSVTPGLNMVRKSVGRTNKGGKGTRMWFSRRQSAAFLIVYPKRSKSTGVKTLLVPCKNTFNLKNYNLQNNTQQVRHYMLQMTRTLFLMRVDTNRYSEVITTTKLSKITDLLWKAL